MANESDRDSSNTFPRAWAFLMGEGASSASALSEADEQKIERRIERIAAWAMAQDKEDLSEHYATVLLTAMTLGKTLRAVKQASNASAATAAQLGKSLADTEGFSRSLFVQLQQKRRQASDAGKRAANARHDRPGAARDKQKAMQDAWASGAYKSRNECAEKMHRELGMGYRAARDALIGTPDHT
jgi:hypothetical protein